MRSLVTIALSALLGACAASAPVPSPSPRPELGEPPGGFDDEQGSAVMLVEEFMKARLSGSGAEVYLTPNAADQYASDAARLYDEAYSGWSVDGVEGVDANSFEITVSITRRDGPGPTERLGVGPGSDSEGRSRPFLVRFVVAV